MVGIDVEPLRHAADEALGELRGGGVVRLLGSDAGRLAPQGRPVLAPVERERPARKRLTRIPLPLAVVEDARGCESLAQPLDQGFGDAPLGRSLGLGVPLRALEVVDADEGGLAAHGESHVAFGESLVDLVTQGLDRLPLLLGVGQRDPRRLPDPLDRHVVGEVALGLLDDAAHGGRGLGLRAARERQMSLPGEEA